MRALILVLSLTSVLGGEYESVSKRGGHSSVPSGPEISFSDPSSEGHYPPTGDYVDDNSLADGSNGGFGGSGSSEPSFSDSPIRVSHTYSESKSFVAVPQRHPVPVTITRHVPVEVPQPYPVTIEKPYAVRVPQPVPVDVPRAVPVVVPRPVAVPVPRHVAVPVRVAQAVPVPVPHPVPVPVPRSIIRQGPPRIVQSPPVISTPVLSVSRLLLQTGSSAPLNLGNSLDAPVFANSFGSGGYGFSSSGSFSDGLGASSLGSSGFASLSNAVGFEFGSSSSDYGLNSLGSSSLKSGWH